MNKLFYTEEQDFRQSPLVWIVFGFLFLGLILNIMIVSGVKAFTDENAAPMTNLEIALTFAAIGIVIAGALIVFLGSKLEVRIYSDGIRYRYPVFIRKEKFISRDEIASVFVGKYNPLFEFGGWGWRIKRFGYKKAFNVSGSKGLRVTLNNGKQIVFGTLREAELRDAVNKMMSFERTNFV